MRTKWLVLLSTPLTCAFVHGAIGLRAASHRSAKYVPDGMNESDYDRLKQREKLQSTSNRPRTFFDRRTLKLETRSDGRQRKRKLSDAERWRAAGALSKAEARQRGAAPKVDGMEGQGRRWWPW